MIYGPTASGKTNIIGAMDTFKSIVLRGNLRNYDDMGNPNTASASLELIPNNTMHTAGPVSFGIKFVVAGMLIEYAFSADLGKFLETEYSRKILSETLSINESIIFNRSDGLSFGNLEEIREFLVDGFDRNEESAKLLSAGSLIDEELFLMNGFKTMFSVSLVTRITEWLDNKFMIIYRADTLHLTRKLVNPQKDSVYIEKT